jgi:hypothetical protein
MWVTERTMADSRATKRLMTALERDGLLLVHDQALPSVTNIVTGQAVTGSWWAHPAAHAIFDAMQPLDRVSTRVKLVAQKVTFVHQRLWPELIAVGSSKARWQTDRLSESARAVMTGIARRRSPVTAAQLLPRADKKERLRVVRDLEVRILIHTDEVHTETGAHAKYLQTWRSFQRVNDIGDDLPNAATARALFEDIVARWPKPAKGRPLLPWTPKHRSANAG